MKIPLVQQLFTLKVRAHLLRDPLIRKYTLTLDFLTLNIFVLGWG